MIVRDRLGHVLQEHGLAGARRRHDERALALPLRADQIYHARRLVFDGRVERIEPGYQLVSARAFSSLPDLVQGSDAALLPGGIWMAMKGKTPTEEMQALPPSVQVFHVEPLTVPGLDAQRCIVWMRRADA